jgi:hypothetical protein
MPMGSRLRNTALTNIIIVIYFNNFLCFALSNVTVFGLRCFADYESPDGSVETDVVACPEVEGFSKKGKILQHRILEHRIPEHRILEHQIPEHRIPKKSKVKTLHRNAFFQSHCQNIKTFR